MSKPTEDFRYDLFEGIYDKPEGLRGCPICGTTRQLTITPKNSFIANELKGRGLISIECQHCKLVLHFHNSRPGKMADEKWYESAVIGVTRRWNTRATKVVGS